LELDDLFLDLLSALRFIVHREPRRLAAKIEPTIKPIKVRKSNLMSIYMIITIRTNITESAFATCRPSA
jgi:hypothetical protein